MAKKDTTDPIDRAALERAGQLGIFTHWRDRCRHGLSEAECEECSDENYNRLNPEDVPEELVEEEELPEEEASAIFDSQLLDTLLSRWLVRHRFDPESRALADRHYNRQKIGSPQFVPPGRCFVLFRNTSEGQALWVSSWPLYVSHAWPGAWINTCFRNEGDELSSDLIREAVAATRFHWGDPPPKGMITFVDAGKVRPKRDPGRCYLRAGFRNVGETKGGLIALQLWPSDMPEAKSARYPQLKLFPDDAFVDPDSYTPHLEEAEELAAKVPDCECDPEPDWKGTVTAPNLEDEAKLHPLPVALVDSMSPMEKAGIAIIRAKALSRTVGTLGEVRSMLIAERVIGPRVTSEDVMFLIHGRQS